MPLVDLSEEEIARRWLYDQALCAIKWEDLNKLVLCYHQFGTDTLVYDSKNMTYFFRKRAKAGELAGAPIAELQKLEKALQ